VPLHLPALLDAKVIYHQLVLPKGAISVVERNIDSCLSESNNVAALITREVGDESRVFLDQPTICPTKVVDNLVDQAERPIAFIQRHIHPIMGTSNNIGLSIACQVGDEAWIRLDAPAPCTVAEVVDNRFSEAECSVAVVATDHHVVLPEANDIGSSITRDISEETKVSIEPPAPALIPEVADTEYRRAEIAIAIVQRDIHSRVSEANDIASSNIPEVRHKPDVLVDAPPTSRVGEGGEDHLGIGESVVTVVGGNEDSAFAKPYNICRFVASGVGEQTDVSIDGPSSSVEAKGLDYGDGMAIDGITHNNDAICPETNDICKTLRGSGH